MVQIVIVNGTYVCLLPYKTINESKENKSERVTVAGVPVYLVQKFLTDKQPVIAFFDSSQNENLCSNSDCNIEKYAFLEEIEVELEYDILEYAYSISDKTCSNSKITSSQHHTIALVDNEDGIIIYPFHSHKSNNAVLFTNHPNKINNSKILEVQNTVGYIITDFFSNGLDQILFLPKLDNIDEILNSGLSSLSMQKHILHTILSHSMLTNANDILYNRNNCTYIFGQQNNILKSSLTSSNDTLLAPTITMPDKINYSTQYATSSKRPTSSGSIYSSNSSDELKTHSATEQNEEPIPTYLNQIDAVINQRLAQHNQFIQKKYLNLQTRKKSIIQSRKAIADLIDNGINTAHIDTHRNEKVNSVKEKDISLQMARLRYKMQHFGKSSFDLRMEVDIYLDDPSMQDNITELVSESATECQKKSNSVHDIFLSASPASNTCNFTKVDTTSGFVPTLLSNECVTISISISITDMVFHGSLEDPFATIALNIYWATPRTMNDTNTSRNASLPIRNNPKFISADKDNGHTKGKILVLFRLPMEMILLQKTNQVQSWHHFDFKSCDSYIPSALFEHRNPRIVAFQSDSMETNIVPNQLFDRLEFDRVDWNTGFEFDENVPSMVIFAESPEKRAGEYIFCNKISLILHL